MALIFIFLTSITSYAMDDFFEYHDRLFKNYNVCTNVSKEVRRDSFHYQSMYRSLKKFYWTEAPNIQVLEYSPFTTTLKSNSSKKVCSLVYYGDCFVAYCN